MERCFAARPIIAHPLLFFSFLFFFSQPETTATAEEPSEPLAEPVAPELRSPAEAHAGNP